MFQFKHAITMNSTMYRWLEFEWSRAKRPRRGRQGSGLERLPKRTPAEPGMVSSSNELHSHSEPFTTTPGCKSSTESCPKRRGRVCSGSRSTGNCPRKCTSTECGTQAEATKWTVPFSETANKSNSLSVAVGNSCQVHALQEASCVASQRHTNDDARMLKAIDAPVVSQHANPDAAVDLSMIDIDSAFCHRHSTLRSATACLLDNNSANQPSRKCSVLNDGACLASSAVFNQSYATSPIEEPLSCSCHSKNVGCKSAFGCKQTAESSLYQCNSCTGASSASSASLLFTTSSPCAGFAENDHHPSDEAVGVLSNTTSLNYYSNSLSTSGHYIKPASRTEQPTESTYMEHEIFAGASQIPMYVTSEAGRAREVAESHALAGDATDEGDDSHIHGALDYSGSLQSGFMHGAHPLNYGASSSHGASISGAEADHGNAAKELKKLMRRQSHNAVERRRRDLLSSLMHQLCILTMPRCQVNPAEEGNACVYNNANACRPQACTAKNEILGAALRHICELHNAVTDMSALLQRSASGQQLDELRAQVSATIERYRSLLDHVDRAATCRDDIDL